MSIRDIPGVIAYRFLPFLGYITLAIGMPWWKKLSGWTLFAILTGAAAFLARDLSEVLLRGPAALAYFALVSLGVYQLKSSVHSGRLPKLVLFHACAFAYVLVPALVYRDPVILVTVVLGWEAMLSAYSYCIDSQAERVPSSRGDCLFFILVNPCLVYAERGSRATEPVLSPKALGRVGLGAVAWTAQAGLQAALLLGLPGIHLGSYGNFLFVCGGAATAFYFAHSGLASVQIGFARTIGCDVPERYAYPFLSRSPAEFWRRWNIYLGAWIKRYVYFPTALRTGRSWGRQARRLGSAAGVLVSFLAVGGLHAYLSMVQGIWVDRSAWATMRIMSVFVAFGAIILVWHGAVVALRRIGERAPFTFVPPWMGTGLWWIAFLHIWCAMAWLFLRAGSS